MPETRNTAFDTICVTGSEVLPENVPSPLYSAVMTCVPGHSADGGVNSWAIADPSTSTRGTVPSTVVPVLNSTVPVGIVDPVVTTVVNVTGTPYVDGVPDVARTVVDGSPAASAGGAPVEAATNATPQTRAHSHLAWRHPPEFSRTIPITPKPMSSGWAV
jgi:hypothetical protein